MEMAPRGRKPSRIQSTYPSHAAKVSIDVVQFYKDYVQEVDKEDERS